MTHRTSCGECRGNYLQDDRDPPCEEKDTCPINAVELLPENDLALDLYNKIEALGAETVFRMVDLTLDQAEADDLLEKMALIAGIIADWKTEQSAAGA